MSIANVLRFAFHLAREHPKTLLPGVIGWIPQVVFISWLAFTLSEISLISILQMLQTGNGLGFFLLRHGAVLMVLTLLSWVSFAWMQVTYIHIARSVAKKKNPRLDESFYESKKRLFSIMWIHVLLSAALILSFAVPAFILTLFVSPIAGVVAGIVASVYVFVRYWLSGVMLVVSDKRGIDALKESMEATKGFFWEIIFVVWTVMLVSAITTSAINGIPFIAFSLTLLLSLFFSVWSHTLAPAFYYERVKK